MNKFLLWRNKITSLYIQLINTLKDNLFLTIGFYGLLFILLIAILAQWIAPYSKMLYPNLKLLMPAWDEYGDLNHLLGVDQNGQDIFKRLVLSLQTSLFIAFVISFCVIIIGSVFSLIAIFIKTVSDSIIVFFRIITTVPPLLMMIIFAIFSGNSLQNLMLVIIITMLPRFIYNLHNTIKHEFRKPYIVALRLDGLTSFGIMRYSVLPNIWPNYLTECINVYILSLLASTTLTFLNFGISSSSNELGIMMRDMVEIMPINRWGFLAPGLAIMTTILLLNFLNFGLQQLFSKGH